jgi:DNA-directed RNA polymerase specialized sigma24 family protein
VTVEQLLAQQKSHVERVVQDLARKHYLSSAEVQELRGAVERAL